MGGPIRILAREKQCVGAGDCVSRPMTEEEKIKYGIKEDRKLKKVKITPPEKEKLLEILAEVQGKTKAIMHAAEVFSVSKTTMLKWIKDYGIDFDAEGRAIVKVAEEVLPVQECPPLTVKIEGDRLTHDGEKLFQGVLQEALNEANKAKPEGTVDFQNASFVMGSCGEMKLDDNITATGEEKKAIPRKPSYVEYDIGNAIVQIDFREKLVNIGKSGEEYPPTDQPISFEEAVVVAKLVLDILGNE